MRQEKIKISGQNGQSLAEIVIALSLFALLATGIAQLAMSSLSALERSAQIKKAQGLAQEAAEGLRAIKSKNWNELIFSTSSLQAIDNKWQLVEGPEIINSFERTIEFTPVYRGLDGAVANPSDPAAVIDILSQDIKIAVRWPTEQGVGTSSLISATRLTAWNAQQWEQSDWSWGAGQVRWLNIHKYYGDDGNIDISRPGIIALPEIATSTYAASGYLISSAYKINSTSTFVALAWQSDVPNGCSVKMQIKTAPDDNGNPGDWSPTWSGPAGEDGDKIDYFTSPTGTLINASHNGDSWIKYKIVLSGDSVSTPTVQQTIIYYQ